MISDAVVTVEENAVAYRDNADFKHSWFRKSFISKKRFAAR